MKHHFLKLNPDHQALLLALACYMLWVCDDTAFKLVSSYHLPNAEMMAVYSLISIATFILFCGYQKKLGHIIPKQKTLPAIRGVMFAALIFCNYIALAHLSLPAFFTVAFTCSFWMTIGGSLFLKERFNPYTAIMIVIGFIGVFISIDRAHIDGQQDTLVGYAAIFASTLFYTAAQLMLRKLSKTETPESMIFSNLIVACVLFAIAAAWELKSFPPEVILIFIFSTCANNLANLAMGYAMKRADASTVASLHYTQIIPGALFGYLIWHNVPAWNVWVGVSIVIATGLGMVYLTKKPKLA